MSEKDKIVHAKNQMSSDVLKVRYRRELSSLSLEPQSHQSFDKKSLAIWLFEWYDSKGRKLPYGNNEKRLNEIPEEELKFFHEILKELPGDFPMIRYSVLWSKWLFPNVKIRNSRESFNNWLSIMKIMEQRFPSVYVNDVDPLVNLLSDYLDSASPNEFELCYVGVKLLGKLVSMYIPPRKGFTIVSGRLLESFRTFYEKENLEIPFVLEIRHEITQLIQFCVSNNHLPSFTSILKNEVLAITRNLKQNQSNKQISSSNYTLIFYKTLITKDSKFDCFLPLIIKKIHDVEKSIYREAQISNNIGGEYLLFFLYLSINLAEQKDFYEKVKYLNECFNFFINVNTFNIRESNDEFGNNFKLRIYELIFSKLQECISKGNLNQSIWKTIENSIIIDPIKCLKLLPDIFLSNKAKKSIIPNSLQTYHKDSNYGPLEVILDFISSEDIHLKNSDFLNSQSSVSSSLKICISKYILTFIKLHDLPLFFNAISELISKDINPKDIHKFEDIFLSTEVLQTIKNNIAFSVLPGQTSDIINSFLGLLKGNSSESFLYECISNSWIGILMITIQITEPSIPNLEEAVRQIHQYIKDTDSNGLFSENSKIIQTTCTLGLIHLLRKLLSWNIERKSEFFEMINYHYDKVLNENYWGSCNEKDSLYSPFNVYITLVHLITLITKLRDSGSLKRDDFKKIFVLYGQILNLYSDLDIDDPSWKVRINKILTKFILLNISHLKGIDKYIKDYVEGNDQFSNLDLFLKSLYEQYIEKNDVPNSLFNSFVQIPYLPSIMIDITLEELNNNFLETGSRKKRKLSLDNVSGESSILMFHDLKILDFWNRKEIVSYFLNNRTELLVEDIFSKISKLYLNLIFREDYVSSLKQDQISRRHSLEKALEGIIRWITLEGEVGADDFVKILSQFFFNKENGKQNILAKYLDLISRVETNSKMSQDLNYILKKSIKCVSRSEKDSKRIMDLVINQMESLDWWWWMNVKKNNEDLLIEKRSWLNQIQLCIDLCSEESFESMKGMVMKNINIFQILKSLKHKLKEKKKIELLYSTKICEFYLGIHPEIQNWEFDPGEESSETQENWPLPRINTLIKILSGILNKIQKILEDSENSKKLLKECFILIDLIISYLKQVIQITKNTLLDLKKNQEFMKLCFGSLEKVYSETFKLFLELIRVNLEFGIYGIDQEDHETLNYRNHFKNVSEWSRYFVKCILEGSSIRKEDYSHLPHIYRQMDIYEIISNLVNSSVTSLLNHAINESMIKVNFTRETNLFLFLSYLDLFWGIIRNKGQIYKCLSPCLRGNLFCKISSWGTSDKLEFSIVVMISRLVDYIEKRQPNLRIEYILCTFSFIRLSNIISILYSCCVRCYITEVKENPRSSLNNSLIIPISNMLLVISSRLSNIGLGLRLEDLESIVKKERMDENTRESFYMALFECLMISPYIPLYTLLNPLWDQSNRKKNRNQNTTGHLDVWISQFHLIEESLKNLVNLGDQISFQPIGIKLYTLNNKRISRLYPLIVSQITKNKVQRYSISLACDLINYINIINKRLEFLEENNEEFRDIMNLNIKIIKSSCLNPILSVIDDHCKQSLFTMLKDEQRIIFKQINKKNSELSSLSKLEG
ncbi:uncharacterized protein cubi_03159 [Cryptosporidium ubiquitum]|uniref:Uncharacterized protein n=1 Tax=Cryptosporidium ubiquitum TaxID=857276 RepID=A0A1J4MLD2_9CRYT|nr:uncharacterized protein cubi_03159 [Cryptosporidium ubiquitum]OII75049.1 hypothetical protein cubi_03159 [Cryptosporidium ubiquitum]